MLILLRKKNNLIDFYSWWSSSTMDILLMSRYLSRFEISSISNGIITVTIFLTNLKIKKFSSSYLTMCRDRFILIFYSKSSFINSEDFLPSSIQILIKQLAWKMMNLFRLNSKRVCYLCPTLILNEHKQKYLVSVNFRKYLVLSRKKLYLLYNQ